MLRRRFGGNFFRLLSASAWYSSTLQWRFCSRSSRSRCCSTCQSFAPQHRVSVALCVAGASADHEGFRSLPPEPESMEDSNACQGSVCVISQGPCTAKQGAGIFALCRDADENSATGTAPNHQNRPVQAIGYSCTSTGDSNDHDEAVGSNENANRTCTQ